MIGFKGWGAKKTPEERALARAAHAEAKLAKTAARADEKVADIAAKAKIEAARAEARKNRRAVSIEKAIIKITDIGFVTALGAACIVAYALDMIFFFQQTTLLWLSLLLCTFGFVIRTIAICGGVVLEWAEEDESTEKPDPLNWEKQRFVSTLRWVGRRFSFSSARMTLRIMTWACWIVCAYATVSFFGSGHEMRKFAQENIVTTEQVVVGSNSALIATLENEIRALEADKVNIRKDRDTLISGARQSMTEAQTDGDTTNDNLDVYEQNIVRYQAEATTEIGKKDTEIERKRGEIRTLQAGSGTAAQDAQTQRAENPPFLAVYTFLAGITGWSTDGWTIWSALLFAFVFELIVDTGLKNYFRLKKRFMARLRTIELRQVVEDAEWELNRFNTISAANLANARARVLAQEAAALQDRELAELQVRTEREKARTEAARLGIPWVDPELDLSIKQKLANAEADERIAKIEAEIREAAARAEALRNPPKPTPPPMAPEPAPVKDWREEIGPDGLNHYQRMNQKSQESKKFDQDEDEIDDQLKVPSEDWRNELRM